MAYSIQISELIYKQGMPIACSNKCYFVDERNEPGDVSVLTVVCELGIFGGSPAVDFSISASTQVKKTSTFYLNNVFALELLYFVWNVYFMVFVIKHSPYEHRTLWHGKRRLYEVLFLKLHVGTNSKKMFYLFTQ